MSRITRKCYYTSHSTTDATELAIGSQRVPPMLRGASLRIAALHGVRPYWRVQRGGMTVGAYPVYARRKTETLEYCGANTGYLHWVNPPVAKPRGNLWSCLSV